LTPDDTDGTAGDRLAVVTGASSGIGRAIALALARAGYRLLVVGRNRERLGAAVAELQTMTSARSLELDLTDDEQVERLAAAATREPAGIDVLVHAAGIIHQEPLANASIGNLDRQYAINVRAPYALTQRLLPLLISTRGQIVFINSSVGIAVNRPEIGPYAATKHALRALADSLRAELNPKGIRVLSVYLGRTATPLQEALFKDESRSYDGGKLLQPEDVATVILAALALPSTAEVTDISIRPMQKS